MTTKSIKLELIHWLSKLNDKAILESLLSVKNSVSSGDWYEELTSSEKKSIDRGIEDHKKGNVLTSKQFWSRYAKKI